MSETLISPTPLGREHTGVLFGPLSTFWCRCRNNTLHVELFVYSHLIVSEPHLAIQTSLKNPEDKTYTLFLPELYRQEDSVQEDLGLSIIQGVLSRIQKTTTVLPEGLEQHLILDVESYTPRMDMYTYPTPQ